MDAKLISNVYDGRVASLVVDMYAVRLLRTCRESNFHIQPADTADELVRFDGLTVLQPIKRRGRWILLVSEPGAPTVAFRGSDADGGLEMIAVMADIVRRGLRATRASDRPIEHGIDASATVDNGVDTLSAMLELAAMVPRVCTTAAAIKIPKVVTEDLMNRRACLSDDSVDFFLSIVQKRCDPKRVSILRCGEVKAWAEARRVIGFETTAAASIALERDFRLTVKNQLEGAEVTICPTHGRGAHECFL